MFQEEIGELIESVPIDAVVSEQPVKLVQVPTNNCHQVELLCNNNNKDARVSASMPRRSSNGHHRHRLNSSGAYDWSDNILAEFNRIIAREISELTRSRGNDKIEARVDYKELLSEFGISDSESSNSWCELEATIAEPSAVNAKNFTDACPLNSDYEEPQDRLSKSFRRRSGSLPEMTSNGGGGANSDYEEPSNCIPYDLNQLHSSSNTWYESSQNKMVRDEAPRVVNNDDDKRLDDSRTEARIANSRLPPSPRTRDPLRLSNNLPRSPMSLKRQKKISLVKLQRLRRPSEVQDVEEVDGSKASWEGGINTPRSAPVTPTEDKRSPFPRFRRKRHSPICQEDRENVVHLVRVSSLPDQDLLRLDEATPMSKQSCRGRAISVSPLTVRSDVTAKRLSESDKDVRHMSPEPELNKCRLASRTLTPKANDVAVRRDIPLSQAVDRSRAKGSIDDANKGTDADLTQTSRSGSVSSATLLIMYIITN